ncbi:MAG: adenylate/guanylate cyclase domain-containing protein [Vicinamibacteria bacterium]
MFRAPGPRTRRLAAFLRRRARSAPERRPTLDCQAFPTLFQKRAVVFTDTADFTVRTAQQGILHFLMLFERVVSAAAPGLARVGGDIVKVEGDSLLLRFQDVRAACRGVDAVEACLRQLNRGKPKDERLAFSYGIGYGDILDLEDDLFGLEVNLASKLGEDLARPGEALLTPAAAASLNPAGLRRLVPYRVVTFGARAIPIQRLKLRRR